MTVTYKILYFKISNKRIILNALNLIDFLLKNGSEIIRDGIIDEIFVIKTFKSFHSTEDTEMNLSDLIQSLATKISDLIENKLKLADKRRNAKKLRLRFSGQSGGGQSMNPEKELEKAEQEIKDEIEKCAKKSQTIDPRYTGFSSEDYMKEIEEKKVAEKFVSSYGKDDEQVEEEIKKEEEEVKTNKTIPKPPTKKKIGLRERLGIKKEKIKESQPEPEPEFDFLGGSSKNENTFTASANNNNNNDLLDLIGGPDNTNLVSGSHNLTNANDETDLIDFGTITSTSNTGQNNGDIDLMVDLNSKNNGISSGGNASTGGRKIGGNMFMDVNNDLFDLTGLTIGKPGTNANSSGNQEGSMGNVQSTGMSSGHQTNYMGISNNTGINGLGTGKQLKKDLNINEFDFI